MYITKRLNFKRLKNIKTSQRHTPHVQWIFPKFFSFTLNSFIIWLFLIDEGRLFQRILPLKCIELRPRRNDLTGSRNTLISFLKSYGIGFSLKEDHINSGFRCVRDLKTSKARYCKRVWWIDTLLLSGRSSSYLFSL